MNKYLLKASVLAFLLIILLFAVSAYAASMVAKDAGGNMVWLYEGPCEVQVILDKINPELRPQFQRGDFLYRGKHLQACWAIGPDGLVYVIDDDGDITKIPLHVFRSDLGA